jgi:ribosomal protein L29
MKTLSELKKKSVLELEKTLAEKQKDIQDFRFGFSGGKVKNVKAAKEARRTVARILTLLRSTKNTK